MYTEEQLTLRSEKGEIGAHRPHKQPGACNHAVLSRHTVMFKWHCAVSLIPVAPPHTHTHTPAGQAL